MLVEVLLAFEIHLGLLQVDVSQTYTALCRAELSHVRNNLYLGYHLASLHILTSLLVYIRDNTGDLWFHIDLIAGLYLTRDDGCVTQRIELGCKLAIHRFFGLALLPEEHERSNENQGNNGRDNQFAVLLHNYIIFIFLPFYFYSSLIASTGLMLMARAAGASPAITPIALTTKAAKMAVQKPTWK